MADLHDLLERRARALRPAPQPDAFDRAMRRAERRHRNRRIGAAVLALAVFAGAGTGLWIAFQPGASRPAPPAATVPVPGPTSTITLPSAPVALAADPDGSTVWVAMPDALVGIITATGLMHPGNVEANYPDVSGDLTGIALQRSPVPGHPNGFVEDAWLSDDGGLVWHVPLEDRGTAGDETVERIDVGGPAVGIAVGADAVWVTVAHEGPGDLVRIDPTTNKITGRFTTGAGPGTVAVGAGGVWVQVTSGDAMIQEFDATSGRQIAEFRELGGAHVAASDGEVWASGADTVGRLSAMATTTQPVISREPSGSPPGPAPIPSAHVQGAGALTISGDQVWVVANPNPEGNGLLSEIDSRTGNVVSSPAPVGMTPTGVVVAGGSVWVANYNDPSLSRIELLCDGSPCAGPSTTPSTPGTTGPSPTGTSGPTTRPPTSGPGTIGTLSEPPVPFLVGRTLNGAGLPDATVDTYADDPYAGTLSPEATLVDSNTLLYNAFQVAPGPGDISFASIHRFDLVTGTDTAIVNSAFSFAVRADGAIAYFRFPAPDIRGGVVPLGSIEVAPSAHAGSLDATATTWSREPGSYVVVGWAGGTLIADRLGAGDTRTDVLALDGPGQVRTLATGAAVVAISPDGSKVLLSERPAGPGRPDSTLVVVDVRDGRTLQQTPIDSLIDPESGKSLGSVDGPGDWIGDEVVAESGRGGVALLRIGPAITVEGLVHWGLEEPAFVDGDPSRIVGWALVAMTQPKIPGTPVTGGDLFEILECSAGAGRTWDCRRTSPAQGPIRPVRSLSRPSP